MSSDAPKVKICGLTRLADAELAVELGAWALGMIFYSDSPRRCAPDEATAIAASLRRRTHLCGVFVNAPLDVVARTVDEVGLDMVQLHGDEGPSFCGEVARRTGARVVKALQVASPGDVQELGRFRTDFHLVDARGRRDDTRGLRGGTGETFDWRLLKARRSRVPLILSGGLTPENVAHAVAAVQPFAVDTATGTEASPGIKDPDKLRALFAAVQNGADDRGGESLVSYSDEGLPTASSGPRAGGAGPGGGEGLVSYSGEGLPTASSGPRAGGAAPGGGEGLVSYADEGLPTASSGPRAGGARLGGGEGLVSYADEGLPTASSAPPAGGAGPGGGERLVSYADEGLPTASSAPRAGDAGAAEARSRAEGHGGAA